MNPILPQAAQDPWWKKPGYYLWLLAIFAIVYAYLFATDVVASSYRGIASSDKLDPTTNARIVNVGNQVTALVGFSVLYVLLAKLWLNVQGQPLGSRPTWMTDVVVTVANAVITIGTLIGLVFVSILATQRSITDIPNSTDGSTSKSLFGFFGANIGLLVIIMPIALFVMAKVTAWNWPAAIFSTFQLFAQFVLNLWVPIVMTYYLIMSGSTLWFQIVAGVTGSVVGLMSSFANFKNLYLLAKTGVAPPGFTDTLKEFGNYSWNTFPISPYLKYVETTNLTDVAKRVMIVALLGYAAYLMVNVYKFKHRLIPCIDSNLSSCFTPWADPSSKDTPYVNSLVAMLLVGAFVNVANWIIQQASIYSLLNNFMNTQPQAISIPANANMTWLERGVQLLKLIGFPIYWLFSLVLNNPVIAIGAVLLFAAVGVLLYRSSFDLTEFIEGQRGTVITLFTVFIVSLIAFALYAANSTTTELVEGTMSYGQFIGKTGMVLAVAVCIVGILLYFLNSHSKLSTVAGIAEFGINAMIYIVGIAILIFVVRTMIYNKTGGAIFELRPDSNWMINFMKMFGNALFCLPCLLLDLVDMLKHEYGVTTRPWLILLAMQAFFILAGHFLPIAVAKTINHTGVQILSAPISVKAPISIKTYDVQFVKAHGIVDSPTTSTTSSGVTTTTVQLKNYSYGVSAWFYIHPQPPNTNANYSDPTVFTEILQVGSVTGPTISYNPLHNTMRFSLYGQPIMTLDKAVLEVSDITLQTWNNVVINSDKGAVDVFINNKLIYTGVILPDTNNNSVQNIILGNDDGIHGEICNVVLNTAPFTKPEIAWLYKTNRTMNPPVMGVNMDPLNQGYTESDLATEAVGNDPRNLTKPAPTPTAMPAYSSGGSVWGGVIGAIIGIIFGAMFNSGIAERTKGGVMGAAVFGLIGSFLGGLFSTDGTVAYVFKTAANVFVDTF